jgi:flagellar biosynthesis protein FliQ
MSLLVLSVRIPFTAKIAGLDLNLLQADPKLSADQFRPKMFWNLFLEFFFGIFILNFFLKFFRNFFGFFL